MTTPTADRARQLGALTLAIALALGTAGCGGTAAQTGPYVEEPTDQPRPNDDGTIDNLDDKGNLVD